MKYVESRKRIELINQDFRILRFSDIQTTIN